jgi:transcription attenuation protein (tryptophan RNA-binding attenuator protein)
MEDSSNVVQAEYIVIKAMENGVTIIGLTRGRDTRFHHTEKLDKGEIMIAQFTENTSAIKVRGKAVLYTRHGVVETKAE